MHFSRLVMKSVLRRGLPDLNKRGTPFHSIALLNHLINSHNLLMKNWSFKMIWFKLLSFPTKWTLFWAKLLNTLQLICISLHKNNLCYIPTCSSKNAASGEKYYYAIALICWLQMYRISDSPSKQRNQICFFAGHWARSCIPLTNADNPPTPVPVKWTHLPGR